MKIARVTKLPDSIVAGYLEVVIMPNGELIHQGKTVGWYDKSKKFVWKIEEGQTK